MTRDFLQETDCFLFDLDGTLVDSAPLHDQAYRHVLETERADLLAGFDYGAVAGLTTQTAFRRIGAAEDEVARLTALKQAHYRALLGGLSEMPGAAALLTALRARGAKVGIVTAASRASALKALDVTGLKRHVMTVIAAEDTAAAKPAAAPFLMAAEMLKTDVAHAVAVEDAPSGIIGAGAAGLKTIGVHNEAIRNMVNRYFADLAAFAEALP